MLITHQTCVTESFTSPRIERKLARKMLRRVSYELFTSVPTSYSELVSRLRALDLTKQYAETRQYRDALAKAILECAAYGWACAITAGLKPHRVTIHGTKAEQFLYRQAIAYGIGVARRQRDGAGLG